MGLDIVVHRMYKFESNRPLKAFVDIIVNDALVIKGIKILEGKHGLFVSMPQEQAKDKKWYDQVRCLTIEVRNQISDVVLEAYSDDSESTGYHESFEPPIRKKQCNERGYKNGM